MYPGKSFPTDLASHSYDPVVNSDVPLLQCKTLHIGMTYSTGNLTKVCIIAACLAADECGRD